MPSQSLSQAIAQRKSASQDAQAPSWSAQGARFQATALQLLDRPKSRAATQIGPLERAVNRGEMSLEQALAKFVSMLE